MRIHNIQLMNEITARLSCGRMQRVLTSADLHLQLHTFAVQLFPSILAGPRAQLAAIFGQLRSASELTIANIVREDCPWSSQDTLLVETNALISGLLFLAHLVLKRDLRKTQEIITFCSERLH